MPNNNSKFRRLSTSLLLLTLPRALTVCTDKRSAACLVSRRGVDCDEVASEAQNKLFTTFNWRENDGVFTPPAAIDCFHSLTSFSLALFIDIIATLCFFCCWAQQTLHCYLIHFFPVYTLLSFALCVLPTPNHPMTTQQPQTFVQLINGAYASNAGCVIQTLFSCWKRMRTSPKSTLSWNCEYIQIISTHVSNQ